MCTERQTTTMHRMDKQARDKLKMYSWGLFSAVCVLKGTYSGQGRAWGRLGCTCWQTCQKEKRQSDVSNEELSAAEASEEITVDSLPCMCVLSGSDCVFLLKLTPFSFSSFRIRRPRLDLIWSRHQQEKKEIHMVCQKFNWRAEWFQRTGWFLV